MLETRALHPDFLEELSRVDIDLARLYFALRNYILKLHPLANELLYASNALVSVYSPTRKLKDAYCHIPIVSNHLILVFNKGALLIDNNNVLKGDDKLNRYIEVKTINDFKNNTLVNLINQSFQISMMSLKDLPKEQGLVISKIK